jgi:hypothetical protein
MKNLLRHYVLDGHRPMPAKNLLEWDRMFTNVHGRIVARTRISKEVEVSTVFLGIDHNFGDHGPPLLFETCIFGGAQDGWMQRTSTWEDAERWHTEAVKIALDI